VLASCSAENPKPWPPAGDTYRQPLEWQERLSIAAQSAGALAYLHQNGIIHRDFRTSNVLLDGEMRAVVSDFGIAKLSVEEGAIAEEVTSQLVRSSGYMAPE
jgi:serine/threonine protein kinase